MAAEVLELLDPDRQYRLYTVVGKAAKEPLAPVTEEGSLHGIDQQIWEKGREYLVFTRYELRPLPEQKAEPGPMLAPEEDSEFVNCFVRRVVHHFRNKMTRAGSGLTPKRRRILKQLSGGKRGKSKRTLHVRCAQDVLMVLEAHRYAEYISD